MKKIYGQFLIRIWLVLVGTGLMHCPVAWAQSIPDTQWSKTGSTVAVTTDGNIVTTERVSQANSFPTLTLSGHSVVKYSLQGNRLSATGLLKGGFYLGGKIQGYDFEAIGPILLTAPTTDGGVAVVGRTSLRGAGVATKIDANGNPRRWEESDIFSFSSENTIDELIGTPDGGFLLLYTVTQTNGPSNALVRKYDGSGNFSWTKQLAYPTPNPSTPDRSLTKGESVINTPDGGYLVVGYYNTTGNLISEANPSLTGGRGWVAKLDGQGNVQWQNLLNSFPLSTDFNGPVPGSVLEMLPVTDVILAADAAGYVLVGFGLPPHTTVIPPPSTALLELNLDGSFKRARLINSTITQPFITLYTSNNTKYYAIGHTSLQGGVKPEILLLNAAGLPNSDPNLFRTVAQRTFDSSTFANLQGIKTAGDGSLVFVNSNNEVVKLKAETPVSGQFALLAPDYNCATGAITFRTSGGNGSTITYTAPGITRSSVTDNFGTVELGLRNDPQVILLTATQSGVSVTYSFDLKAACNTTNPNQPQPPRFQPIPDQVFTVGQSLSGFLVGAYFSDPTTGVPNYAPNWSFNVDGLPDGLYIFYRPTDLLYTPQPPVTILGTPTKVGVYTVTVTASTGAFRNTPIVTTFRITVSAVSGGGLTLIAPDYNCATGAITFKTTGGDGSLIEYQSPGITGWTSNPNQFVDKDSRTANDVQPFQLMARQSGKVVTYTWDLKEACGRARIGAQEPNAGLQIRVMGNPVVNQMAELEITGVTGQFVQLHLADGLGHTIHQHTISQAGSLERVSIPVGRTSGLLLLQVYTSSERQTVKLLIP